MGFADGGVSDYQRDYSQSSTTSEVYQVYVLHPSTEIYRKSALLYDLYLAISPVVRKKLFRRRMFYVQNLNAHAGGR